MQGSEDGKYEDHQFLFVRTSVFIARCELFETCVVHEIPQTVEGNTRRERQNRLFRLFVYDSDLDLESISAGDLKALTWNTRLSKTIKNKLFDESTIFSPPLNFLNEANLSFVLYFPRSCREGDSFAFIFSLPDLPILAIRHAS
jgi:hypothetical protein